MYSCGKTEAIKPNFLIFLIDDLGWKHVGYHCDQYKTPVIDKLAKEGIKLERFYALPLCSPTRAALLTGRYPIRYGLQTGVVRPWQKEGLPLDEVTLAQSLKKAGYKTAIFGKWHLGHSSPEQLPLKRGFDRQYGHYNGMIDYFTHLRLGGYDWHRDDKVCYDEGYTTDLIAREAVNFVENEVEDSPFFLYVPFNAIHTPLQAPQHWLDKVDDSVPECDRVLQAMLYSIDSAVGDVVAALESKGIRENTLILFISDNGGEIYRSNDPYRDHKETIYEGGVRVVSFANWPGRLDVGKIIEEPLHIVDIYPTLLNLAGVEHEGEKPLDGINIWPVLAGDTKLREREILVNAEYTRGAIIIGDYKLVVRGIPAHAQMELDGIAGADFLYLYNLRTDPYETINLAHKMPEKTKEMLERYTIYWNEAKSPVNVDKPSENLKVPKIWGDFNDC